MALSSADLCWKVLGWDEVKNEGFILIRMVKNDGYEGWANLMDIWVILSYFVYWGKKRRFCTEVKNDGYENGSEQCRAVLKSVGMWWSEKPRGFTWLEGEKWRIWRLSQFDRHLGCLEPFSPWRKKDVGFSVFHWSKITETEMADLNRHLPCLEPPLVEKKPHNFPENSVEIR